MSNGFDINFEGIDMNPDHVQDLLKKYKKIKKYQKSNLFAIKTMDGTEEIVSKMIEEASEAGFDS
jgi:ABC-type nitrate/sulfonate/bicarbonate transport system substrate-binding protein